tara:strand:+ start:1691 stop:2860 length:1170 start_codon:yes stop_codon:yes gene_type:complete
MIYFLSDLFKFIRNGLSVKHKLDSEGLPVTRIETIASAKINLKKVGYAGVDINNARDYLLEDGDILFSHINSVSHIGKCAIYKKSMGELVHGMNLLCFRVDTSKLLPKYALYLLRSKPFKNQLAKSIKKSVNQASVTTSDIKKIKLEIPSLIKQKHISNLLDTAHKIISKRELAIKKLDQLAQSAFTDIFGDPVKNDKNFKEEKLGNVCQFYGGSTLPTPEEYQIKKQGVHLMKVSDMNSEGNKKFIKKCREWSSHKHSKSSVCPIDTLIIPKRGGAIGTNKKRLTLIPVLLDPNLMGIKANEKYLNTQYLYQWFLQFDLSTIASGSSVPQLNKKDLFDISIQIPKLNLQSKFSEIANQIQKTRESYNKLFVFKKNLISSIENKTFSKT